MLYSHGKEAEASRAAANAAIGEAHEASAQLAAARALAEREDVRAAGLQAEVACLKAEAVASRTLAAMEARSDGVAPWTELADEAVAAAADGGGNMGVGLTTEQARSVVARWEHAVLMLCFEAWCARAAFRRQQREDHAASAREPQLARLRTEVAALATELSVEEGANAALHVSRAALCAEVSMQEAVERRWGVRAEMRQSALRSAEGLAMLLLQAQRTMRQRECDGEDCDVNVDPKPEVTVEESMGPVISRGD